MINKSYIKKIILALLIIIIGMTFVMGNNQVYAANSSSANTSPESGITSFFSISSFPQLINSAFAWIISLALGVAGFLLSIAGYLLDVSIRLTLHIKDFVEATPVIYSVWKILRDITGLFFIFYLLYASILMITGVDTSKFGKTLKDIVLAGILINFSFFIVSLGIDASNVVSQSIYNAMLPNKQIVIIKGETKISDIVKSSGKSDISNIFMNSLKIQQIYDSKGNRLGTNISDPIKMVLIGIAGIIMMIATAASFVFASIAFVARLVILLFILAFSPIIFAARVLPNLSEKAKEITKILQDQLIFMPVYLLLMYVGLRILNESNMFGAGNISNSDISVTGTNWTLPYIILAINFVIVMFVLNLPLAVGLSMGGRATDFMKNKMGNWDGMKMLRNFAPNTWKNTGGRLASKISRNDTVRDWASKSGTGEMVYKGLNSAAGSYNKKLSEQVDARTKFADSLGYNEKEIAKKESGRRFIKEQEAAAKARGDTAEVARLKARADQLEDEIINKKKERQANYAERITSKTSSGTISNLWLKVARKDKVAAAKINTGVWQKQLDIKKDDLKKAKEDLEKVKKEIKNDRKQGRPLDPADLAKETRLEGEILTLTSNSNHNGNISQMGVNDLQDLIDENKAIA